MRNKVEKGRLGQRNAPSFYFKFNAGNVKQEVDKTSKSNFSLPLFAD